MGSFEDISGEAATFIMIRLWLITGLCAVIASGRHYHVQYVPLPHQYYPQQQQYYLQPQQYYPQPQQYYAEPQQFYTINEYGGSRVGRRDKKLVGALAMGALAVKGVHYLGKQ